MRFLSIGFLLGILLTQQFATLSVTSWQGGVLLCPVALLVVVPLMFPFLRPLVWKYRFLVGILSGFCYALWLATATLETRLPSALEGKDLIVSGDVASIPYQRKNGWKFRLNIHNSYLLDNPDKSLKLQGVVRLGWYKTERQIHAGEHWQMVVRLKRPSGFMNPGGFDYEKWLFQQRIIATGYVRKSASNKRLAPASHFSVNAWREKLLRLIHKRIDDPQLAAIVGALAVAERTAISDQQWELLRNTGTNHLIAISGLHIGMVAGFGFLPVWLIWWLFPTLYQKIPARTAGAILGAVFAIVYALLAGFTLPTQRALIMVLVVLASLLAKKQLASSSILSIALFAVLLFDPLAVLSQGFWLSFVAVALILFTLGRRIRRQRYDILSIQFALSLGMLPLTLAFFGTGSLSSPIANLLAIPWVTIVVVPLTLLGLALFPFTSVSTVLLNLAANSVDILFHLLSAFSSPRALISISDMPAYLLVLAFMGFLWIWLPGKFPARWLGLVFIMPLLIFQPEKIKTGAFQYHLLDVGQGLASVVQTANHVLVYDAGPRANARFDTGKLVVLPFLRAKNIRNIDTLLISHEDIDHRGGAAALLEKLSIKQIMSSDTSIFPHTTECIQGMHWQWDGVSFEILNPQQGWQDSDNNRSCVLRISNKHHSLLLTADIEIKAERSIMASTLLPRTEVILMPHHGSKSSSDTSFLEQLKPGLALVSAGYRNPFHQPHPHILERYHQQGIKVLSTIDSGEISVYFPADATVYRTEEYRKTHQRYWHRRVFSRYP